MKRSIFYAIVFFASFGFACGQSLPEVTLDDAWKAPFFFEDRRNVFYVTTNESLPTLASFKDFGILSARVGLNASLPKIPSLILRGPGARSQLTGSIAQPLTKRGVQL